MERIDLLNDYNYCAHPSVLETVREASTRLFAGYGVDEECMAAAEMIRGLIGKADADVHFIIGGTQANLIAIGAFLRPHEAVVAPAAAHINMHETGAIEAVGHKILTFPASDGKARADDVRAVMESHDNEHMVKPKLLFISQATELGTVYTRAELIALREVCDEYGLFLYADGARLGNALVSDACDFTLHDFAGIADAFYNGGTKNGLLFGEAMVRCNKDLAPEFRYLMKQRGGLLAKGFLLGLQFRAIFEEGLYFELARRANSAAASLETKLRQMAVPLLIDTVSNQVFPYVSDEALSHLEEQALFETWGTKGPNGTPIRFVTTWQTTEAEIDAVLRCIEGDMEPERA
jgi:threonine aldolase